MGAMFRSEEMALCQLFLQPEAAYSFISIIGEQGIVQFKDLNENVNAFQRKFVNEVRRCGEMDRILRYIEEEINKDGVTIPELEEIPKAPNPREIIDLEARLEKTENEILELNNNSINLQTNFLELTELKHVLEKSKDFFSEQEASDMLTSTAANEENAGQVNRGQLGYVAGVVSRERIPAFEKMLWRVSRGNVFFRHNPIEDPLKDPKTRNEIYKNVFVAFYQGDELKTRVQKICTGFHANLYPFSDSNAERQEMLEGVRTRLEDLNMVLNQTKDHRERVLGTVAKDLQNWHVMVKKMKAIYHTLNMFNMDITNKCLIGECWVPISDLAELQNSLIEGGKLSGSSIPSFLNVIQPMEKPPTFNRSNKFTQGFQNLIDSYGVASYREVNPALYTIITFPFLFAVMFGDAGHGLILFLFGLAMVLTEKKMMNQKLDEITDIFFGGRYIVLLMGLFSMYTGIIYNDIFSKSFNIFGSRWRVNQNESWIFDPDNKDFDLDPRTDDYKGTPYFMGIDPVWQIATANKIIFLNSFKMKLSIIFGVLHMIFGVSLKVVNYVHFRTKTYILLEFLPQLLFLVLLFLYLVVLMFLKWILYSADADSFANGTRCAPSVLIIFINMMLLKKTEVEPGCEPFMFKGQDILQKVCLFTALVCIPVMLLGKPLYLLVKERRSKKSIKTDENDNPDLEAEVAESGPSTHHPTGEHEDEPFGEIMIHQGIETIEYVLSTISHTASYLRLWALSLAHAQLSDVLWTMLFRIGFKMEGYVGVPVIFILFSVFAFLTVGILVMMEGLSAFLHTLRLHWVEFMSKFYKGEGYLFAPFSFKTILNAEDGNE